MDNFGNSVGLVADWIAVARGWRSDSPAACRCGGDSNHQSCDWSTSRINPQKIRVICGLCPRITRIVLALKRQISISRSLINFAVRTKPRTVTWTIPGFLG